jgi:pyruvate dehydrogenase E1 component
VRAAVIVDHGIRRMLDEQRDEFFYITVMNENYSQPSLPEGVEQDVIRGMYRLRREEPASPRASLRLLGSGAILCEVIAAAELLAKNWNIASEIFSVTSFSELAREAREIERWNRLHPSEAARQSHVEALLAGNTPVVAATDYVRAYPQLICLVHARSLRRAGHGRFRTQRHPFRTAGFFEVDRHHVAIAALDALARDGAIGSDVVAEALTRYGVNTDAIPPWERERDERGLRKHHR